MHKNKIIFTVAAVFILAFAAFAQDEEDAKNAQPQKLKPVIENGQYGTHERNIFDLWRPASNKPTPLVLYIHGGGFVNGSKEKITANQITNLLKAGYAIMAINYRLLPEGQLPNPYMDAARAIQFARFNAKPWNIDKNKVAVMGSSAGGLTSLWVAFHDDMADPASKDPISRESTRVSVAAVFSAQTTVDPDVLEKRIGPAVMKHNYAKGKLFGLTAAQMKMPEHRQAILANSPMTYLTKDDPPVWAIYSVEDKPVTDETTTSDAIHHPNFGKVLKEKMDELGIKIKLRHKNDGQNVTRDMIDFMNKAFKK